MKVLDLKHLKPVRWDTVPDELKYLIKEDMSVCFWGRACNIECFDWRKHHEWVVTINYYANRVIVPFWEYTHGEGIYLVTRVYIETPHRYIVFDVCKSEFLDFTINDMFNILYKIKNDEMSIGLESIFHDGTEFLISIFDIFNGSGKLKYNKDEAIIRQLGSGCLYI